MQRGVLYPCHPGAVLLLGRPDAGNSLDIECSSPHVSRRHCEIHVGQDGTIRVVNLGTYGTFVNGRRVDEAVLRAGDRIVLGYDYAFILQAAPDSRALAGGEMETMARPSPPTHLLAGLASTETGKPPASRPPGEIEQPFLAGVKPVSGAPAQGHDMIGTRYRVVRELGRGGVGIVYQADDLVMGTRCAIKLLLPGGKPGSDAIERFKREAMLSARLGEHRGIVRAFDLGILPETGELYCVMEYVDGMPLAKLIADGIPRYEGVRICHETALAVAYAHARGVVHRDLKPENVLVSHEGEARLTDFGLAKAVEDGPGLTATGVAFGTPQYMAPEQIESSRRAGAAADVYSLGGILYAVLTRRPPVTGRKVKEVLEKVRSGSIDRPRSIDATIEPELDELAMRALSRRLEDRPASAKVFADELERWLAAHRPATDMDASRTSLLERIGRFLRG